MNQSKFQRALELCVTARRAGEVLNYDVARDRHGYRYIMAENEFGWSEWFNEAMEDEFSNEYRNSWMLGGVVG